MTRLRRVLRTVDRAWPLGAFVVGCLVSLSISARVTRGWERVDLVGRLDPTTRAILYGSLATSGGALLGLTMASIAILLTLDPARARVADMQSLDAWAILNMTLITAGAFLALVLLVSTVALGVDDRTSGNGILETVVTTVSVVAFAEFAVGGAAFAIVVHNLTSRNT